MNRITSRSLLLALCLALTSGAGAAEKITYLLPAPAFLPAFGPWMLAKARGYYADEGLDVTFQTAKGGVDVAKQVGAGNAPIGGGIGDTCGWRVVDHRGKVNALPCGRRGPERQRQCDDADIRPGGIEQRRDEGGGSHA